MIESLQENKFTEKINLDLLSKLKEILQKYILLNQINYYEKEYLENGSSLQWYIKGVFKISKEIQIKLPREKNRIDFFVLACILDEYNFLFSNYNREYIHLTETNPFYSAGANDFLKVLKLYEQSSYFIESVTFQVKKASRWNDDALKKETQQGNLPKKGINPDKFKIDGKEIIDLIFSQLLKTKNEFEEISRHEKDRHYYENQSKLIRKIVKMPQKQFKMFFLKEFTESMNQFLKDSRASSNNQNYLTIGICLNYIGLIDDLKAETVYHNSQEYFTSYVKSILRNSK